MLGIAKTVHARTAVMKICLQAPLDDTVADFWQMIWEQRCTVAMLFGPPFDAPPKSIAQNDPILPRFWPHEGNAIYHNFEVRTLLYEMFSKT